MPYIKQELRSDLLHWAKRAPNNPGELNFVITEIIACYLVSRGKSYQTCNDILGALDGASKEFYRRIVAPYEDEKIKENGDVYG